MKTVDEAEMLHRMAAYCSSGEHCRRDVAIKTAAAGLTEDECERIIDRLVSERFIDENRYAQSFAKDKFRFNKWGRIRIVYELRQKNIPKEIITEAVAVIDEDEYRRALSELLKTKKRTVREDRNAYMKLFSFAAGRGFENGIIRDCLKELLDGEGDDTDID